MDDGIPMPVMRCGMMDDEHPLWRHLMKLGLDEKQLVTAREVRSSVMKDTIRKKADEQAAGIDLKDLLDRDPVDIKAVEAKLRQIESLRTEMRLSLIRAMEEIKLKLTPQQRKRLKEMPAMEPLAGRGVMGEMRHGPGGMPQVCDKQE
jgi:Spy/CpxP family protein refolding chaperone